MARSTHGYIVKRVSPVLSIYISPLNTFVSTTLGALSGVALNPSNPIVQSTVANILALPRIVIFTLRHMSYCARSISLTESRILADLQNVFGPSFSGSHERAISRTVVLSSPLEIRRQSLEFFRTIIALYYHKYIIGERQVRVNG